jgi:hypothetical protein
MSAEVLPNPALTISMFPLFSPRNTRSACKVTLLSCNLGDEISEQFEDQLGRGCVKKLIFDLCAALIAIGELISCTAS